MLTAPPSGILAASLRRSRNLRYKKDPRDTLASLARKKLPLLLPALLRLAMLPHRLQRPRHRGRFNQSL